MPSTSCGKSEPARSVVRQATAADSARIAELLNAISREQYGEADLTDDEVRTWFAHEEMEVLLAERDGEPVGYGDRWREAERDRAWLDVRAPAGEAQAAEALLRELERRASPDVDPGALAMTYVAGVDGTVRGIVENAGYELVRHSFRMSTPLDGDLVTPEWPDGIEVATYRPDNEPVVHAAHQEAFADHWEHKQESLEEWRKWLVETPAFDPSLWFVAWDGDDVAGLSLCRVHASGDAEHGFVSVLATRRPWRRRGVGTALLLHSFADMQRRGMTKASLGVDGENTTGAVRLYERAGMAVERQTDIFRKEL
jgi:mycothiol synthase